MATQIKITHYQKEIEAQFSLLGPRLHTEKLTSSDVEVYRKRFGVVAVLVLVAPRIAVV